MKTEKEELESYKHIRNIKKIPQELKDIQKAILKWEKININKGKDVGYYAMFSVGDQSWIFTIPLKKGVKMEIRKMIKE